MAGDGRSPVKRANDIAVQDESQDNEVLTLFQEQYNSPATNPAIPLLLAKGPGSMVLREEEISDAEWHRSGLTATYIGPPVFTMAWALLC